MSATAKAPGSLRDRDDFIVRYEQATDTLTLLLDDTGDSFDIGSFTTSYADAVPYLTRAMGGGMANQMFAEEIISTARNFGTALADLIRCTSVPVHDNSVQRTERVMQQVITQNDPSGMFSHLDEDRRMASSYVEPNIA